MKYIQVEIKLDQVHIEPVTGLLLTMGIDETAVEDPSDLEGILSKEHGYEWDYIDDGVMTSSGAAPKITFYLDQGEDERADSLARKIEAEFPKPRSPFQLRMILSGRISGKNFLSLLI